MLYFSANVNRPINSSVSSLPCYVDFSFNVRSVVFLYLRIPPIRYRRHTILRVYRRAIIFSGLFFLTVIFWLKKQLFSSPMKIANNAEPNAPKYESPIWTRYATHEDPHPKVSERTLRDETGIDNELVEENILPELGEILKGVFYFFIAFLSVFFLSVFGNCFANSFLSPCARYSNRVSWTD